MAESLSDDSMMRIYDECAADLADLIHAWTTFVRISRCQETVELLNKVSGHFFGGVLAALRTHAVTLATKLLERPVVAGKRTASLEVLFAEARLDANARETLMTELIALRGVAKPVITYRHQRVVHSDYEIRTQGLLHGIPSLAEFEKVRRGIRNLMREFEKALGLPNIPYENSDGSRDVDEVARVLSRGLVSG